MTISETRIHSNWSLLDACQRLVDGASILSAFTWARTQSPDMSRADWMVAVGAAVFVYGILSELCGVYRDWRGSRTESEVLCAVATWCGTVVCLVFIAWSVDFAAGLSRSGYLTCVFGTAGTIAAFRASIRIVLKVMRSKGLNTRRFAVVGVGELGFKLARNIEETPALGLQMAGFYDDRPATRTGEIPPEVGGHLGTIDDLLDDVRQGRVDMVYITFPLRAEERIRRVLERLSDSTASVYLVPDFLVFQLLHSRWTNINGLPVVSIFDNPFYGADGLLKRLVDLCLGIVGGLLFALPMLVIACLVKASSPGPVLFGQKRYGLDGREITVWKFRTMLVCENDDEIKQATVDDPRITPLGRFLRRTSLDELPQLYNVLCGNMSLVGPRPHAKAHNEAYRHQIEGYMLRHKVKPGITGLAQVNGWRGETDTLEKMQQRVHCDHQYIREWSLWMDVKILAKTLWVVAAAKNAY